MNKSTGTTIDKPILFNPWKHHLGFIKEKILQVKNEIDLEEIRKNLLQIGDSQMDLYFGNLKLENIVDQIYSYIQSNNLTSKDKYQSWLTTDLRNGYSQLTISDISIWTLRLGNEDKKYIHIHPSRYSPFTIRIKSIVLKTGILLFSYLNFQEGSYIDLSLINHLRKKYLNESSLKALDFQKGLGKFLVFLSKELKIRREEISTYRED